MIFLALAILLIAWAVEMPLWVSIVCTVLAGIKIAMTLISTLLNILNKYSSNDEED